MPGDLPLKERAELELEPREEALVSLYTAGGGIYICCCIEIGCGWVAFACKSWNFLATS
jgi:hypothetical protein